MQEYYGNNDYRDYLLHSGRIGMKWYVRNHQDYETKPTRSGKVGRYYGPDVEHRKAEKDKRYREKAEKYQHLMYDRKIRSLEKKDRRAREKVAKFEYKAITKKGAGPNFRLEDSERYRNLVNKSKQIAIQKDFAKEMLNSELGKIKYMDIKKDKQHKLKQGALIAAKALAAATAVNLIMVPTAGRVFVPIPIPKQYSRLSYEEKQAIAEYAKQKNTRMSNEELTRDINRMLLEQQHRKLRTSTV